MFDKKQTVFKIRQKGSLRVFLAYSWVWFLLSNIFELHISKVHTVFPHIVSSLEYFPPLNSFPTLVRKLFKFSLHRRKTNAETIWIFQGFAISKKNSCRGNFMRKYGIFILWDTSILDHRIGRQNYIFQIVSYRFLCLNCKNACYLFCRLLWYHRDRCWSCSNDFVRRLLLSLHHQGS